MFFFFPTFFFFKEIIRAVFLFVSSNCLVHEITWSKFEAKFKSAFSKAECNLKSIKLFIFYFIFWLTTHVFIYSSSQ